MGSTSSEIALFNFFHQDGWKALDSDAVLVKGTMLRRHLVENSDFSSAWGTIVNALKNTDNFLDMSVVIKQIKSKWKGQAKLLT